MMRTGMAIVALTVSAGLLAAAPESRPQRQPDIRLSAMVEKLDLTAAQKEKVAAIAAAAQAAAAAEQTPDGKYLVWTRAVEKVKADVLTDAQRKALADAPASVKPGAGLMSMAERLGLSDEQRVKVKGIVAAAEAAARKAPTPPDRHKIWLGAFEEIQKDVLTPAQRARLSQQPAAARPGAGLASMLMTVGLTPEQEKKIAAMISEAESRGAGKTADEKHVIWLTALEDIKKKVLTDEQRKKLEAGMSAGPARGHGGGMGGMPPGHGGGMGGMPPGHGGGMGGMPPGHGGGMGGGASEGSAPLMEMLETVGLTSEQKTRAKAIIDAAIAKAAGTPAGGDTHAVWKAALDEVRRTVLTEEQRRKLPSGMGPVRPSVRLLMELDRVSLTPDQQTKARTLLEAAETKADTAPTPEARRAIWTKAMDEIRNNILTDAQRKTLASPK